MTHSQNPAEEHDPHGECAAEIRRHYNDYYKGLTPRADGQWVRYSDHAAG